MEKLKRSCRAEEPLNPERDGGRKCHGIAVMERWDSTPQSRAKGLCAVWITVLLRPGVKTTVGKMVGPAPMEAGQGSHCSPWLRELQRLEPSHSSQTHPFKTASCKGQP